MGRKLNARDLVQNVLAVVCALIIGVGIIHFAMFFRGGIVETPYGDGTAYSYPLIRIGIVAGIGVVLIVLGFRLGLDRQFYNWVFVGIGAAVLILGTSFIALERAVVTSEYFELRSWWGLSVRRWHYDDIANLRYVDRPRRRHDISDLQVRLHDGRRVTVCDTNLYGLYGPFERDVWRHTRARGIPGGHVSEVNEGK